MTTIRWAILFFWLLIVLAIFWPVILNVIRDVFNKEKREEIKKEMKEEEAKEPEWKKKKRENIYRILAFIAAVIVCTLLFK